MVTDKTGSRRIDVTSDASLKESPDSPEDVETSSSGSPTEVEEMLSGTAPPLV